MATLPSILNPTITGLNKSSTARVLSNDFGDGYRQRAPDGINSINRDVSVEFIGDNTAIDTYVLFFEEHYGSTSFDWIPPAETVSYKWTCIKWSISYNSTDISTIAATFRKEFDLD